MINNDNTPTAYEVRMVREGMLQDSDYVVLMYTEKGVDVPQSWIDYRQALRDIPSQTGFPSDPNQKVPSDLVWPTKPE